MEDREAGDDGGTCGAQALRRLGSKAGGRPASGNRTLLQGLLTGANMLHFVRPVVFANFGGDTGRIGMPQPGDDGKRLAKAPKKP